MSQVNNQQQKAIVLTSGGLDSTTVLALALKQGYTCYPLIFDYGQKHRSEINAINRILKNYTTEQPLTVSIDLRQIGGSALTDDDLNIPTIRQTGIPITYVPARNTLFLSYALAYAETISAQNIFIGVNAVDYSGYPDCRPEFITAFQNLVNLATKQTVEGQTIRIHTPLIDLTKCEIIKLGHTLSVDYSQTVSCYQATDEGLACGKCDSCIFRKQGFTEAKLQDPTRYIS